MSEAADRDARTTPEAPPRRRRFRKWLFVSTAALGVVALLGAGFVGVAEYYTAQPNFCASCHIMEPYYATWKNDPHGGKANVACVDCHYAPGERSTIHAKLRGLSQVASYFSGRYGATRPRAHVAAESCLTSACHGDGAFMDKALPIGTVTFRHATHLRTDAQQEKAKRDRLMALKQQLEKVVGAQNLRALETAARVMGPADAQVRVLTQLCEGWGTPLERSKLGELIELEHRPVRISQLASLQCVDCHSNNLQTAQGPSIATGKAAEGQHHFSVQTSSCYTCHFKNESFNTGTAACMVCHEPPQKTITIHGDVGEEVHERLNSPALAKAAIRMDHSDIVARNVDCRSCHADVIVGDSAVSRRDCERCHDRADYFADWKPPLTTELVTKFHAVHVPQQRAKCLDCHTQVQHQLAGKGTEVAGAEFLNSPMSDCTHCHTDQHRNVVSLLEGKGGHSVTSSDPNMMFGSRTNCFGCHTEADRIAGSDVMVATQKACVTCHGESYGKTFAQWKEMLDLSLQEAQTAYTRARAALAAAKAATPETRTRIQGVLAGASADLELVLHGNGVHNVTYALMLLDAVQARCNEAAAELQLGP